MKYMILFIIFCIIIYYLIKKNLISKKVSCNTNVNIVNKEDINHVSDSSDIIQINKVIKEKTTEKLYQLQTDNIRYKLYDIRHTIDYSFQNIYKKIVLEHLWINEPFYTIFYKLLVFLNKSELMIIDKYSRVLILNTRDKNNNIITSKSYQVFSTKKIIITTIENTMDKIMIYNQNDAQLIFISIFIFIIQKSTNEISKNSTNEIINEILNDKNEDIYLVIDLIKKKSDQFLFINNALSDAFICTKTEPYNDSIKSNLITLPINLPEKKLISI